MSVPFYSDDSALVNRKVDVLSIDNADKSIEISDIYDLDRCAEWIKCNDFNKIALQFPDNLLQDASAVALRLEKCTSKAMFVLGDTSYGSCCVDEISAEHATADAIIHFGHACLSPTQRLPVLYIFGKSYIDDFDATSGFQTLFPDVFTKVIIIYEVVYTHAIGKITGNLKDYKNLVISQLEIPSKESKSSADEVNDNQVKVTKCKRCLIIPKSDNLNDYSIFYIGHQSQTLTNFMLAFNYCKFYTYNPLTKVNQPERLDLNKYLKKRYYYIEKTKDAKIIGILVGTLGVSDYLKILNHLRELIKEAGKKSYTLVVGKLNTAKLANFAEIECFVNVACSESSVIDCHEFYQPIITPFELEIALNQAREWTGDYVTDFSELLPGAALHIPPQNIKKFEGDVSLITGKMRSSAVIDDAKEVSNETSALVSRDEMTISTIHSQAAGEYLTQRTWRGLEQCLGETPVAEVQKGLKGIACQYEEEGHD